MRIAFAAVLALHGLLHLLGFAKAFGLAALPQLVQPIARPTGLAWLLAALLSLATVGALFLAPRWWWAVGAVALLASQAVLATSWSDARFGTLANLVLLVGCLHGFAWRGPWSLRSAFEHDLARAAAPAAPQLLGEAELLPLPEPVRRYLRRAGVVGQPRVRDFRATWKGRIRSDVNSAWMAFTAEQFNTLDVPRRYFMMDATMKGLPVDVLHAFDERGATMRVRVLSVVPMVDAKGPALTRIETVTLFNDLCILAPGALVSPAVAWEPVDAHTARARYTQGANTVAAELTFNDAGELVDFASDDRAAGSPDGRTFTPMRWTTPVRDYALVGPARVATRAETLWHPASGAWSYGEFQLTSLRYNVGP
jgi:hypothetical protein